jgi:hypothetical protein
MGYINTAMRLSNPAQPNLAPVEATALADTAALFLCIPAHVASQLSLATLNEREVTLADGSVRKVPYVGPVKVEVANRACFTW